ncbi:MAG: hypothetical protein RDU20_23945 [Desulfomonilaceae bacterium]|nr:hypothetical protein [Desulfomonilaceae bacterium]
MKRCAALVLAAALFLALTTSCTSMRSLTAVKAGYDAEQQDSWASRYIPGVRAISRLVPPPSDARKEWDARYNKRNHQGDSADRYPDL